MARKEIVRPRCDAFSRRHPLPCVYEVDTLRVRVPRDSTEGHQLVFCCRQSSDEYEPERSAISFYASLHPCLPVGLVPGSMFQWEWGEARTRKACPTSSGIFPLT